MQTVDIETQFGVKSLPYDYTALSPLMSERTLILHHDKHYAGYVANLNRLTEGSKYADMPLSDVMLNSTGAIFNNAAQAWNHEFFFEQFSRSPRSMPTRNLAAKIDLQFGSFDMFKMAVADSATQLFGSGWVWVVVDEMGALSIVNESNAGNPLTRDLRPIMTIDVWEHAYYVDCENRRAEYVDNFWKIVDWEVLESRF